MGGDLGFQQYFVTFTACDFLFSQPVKPGSVSVFFGHGQLLSCGLKKNNSAFDRDSPALGEAAFAKNRRTGFPESELF
jgi:hypothetical protein